MTYFMFNKPMGSLLPKMYVWVMLLKMIPLHWHKMTTKKQTNMPIKSRQLLFFFSEKWYDWTISHQVSITHPPHPQPSIKCSLLPLRYGGASYSSPGREPQSVGGRNSLFHPLSFFFLLLPPSKGGGRRKDNLKSPWCHDAQSQKTRRNKREDVQILTSTHPSTTSYLRRLHCF